MSGSIYSLGELPVPPPVEDVGGDQQQEVLRPQVAVRHEPIQPEDNRQKDQKLRAVEEHDGMLTKGSGKAIL